MQQTKQDNQPEIGEKLRLLRRSRSMTLGQIAELAGCSESMVSKIETGRVTPSLSLLRRIADVLGTNIAALFDSLPSSEVVSRNGSRPRILVASPRASEGHIVEQLMPTGAGIMLQANMHTIQVGGTTGDVISHFGDEFGYVMSGTMIVRIDGEDLTLKAGDSFHFKSERPHTYANPGPDVVQMILVNTPPSF